MSEGLQGSDIADEHMLMMLCTGVPKHHICNANLMRNGADFSVFVNTAQVGAAAMAQVGAAAMARVGPEGLPWRWQAWLCGDIKVSFFSGL